MNSGCRNLGKTICKTPELFHKRKRCHATIVIEGNEEEYQEIRKALRKTLAKCQSQPSYYITGVDFPQQDQ